MRENKDDLNINLRSHNNEQRRYIIKSDIIGGQCKAQLRKCIEKPGNNRAVGNAPVKPVHGKDGIREIEEYGSYHQKESLQGIATIEA